MVRSTLSKFAVVNAILAVANLLPFVKLDGYWMLASALDRPNLRAEAIADAARLFGREQGHVSLPLAAFSTLSWLTGRRSSSARSASWGVGSRRSRRERSA